MARQIRMIASAVGASPPVFRGRDASGSGATQNAGGLGVGAAVASDQLILTCVGSLLAKVTGPVQQYPFWRYGLHNVIHPSGDALTTPVQAPGP